MCCKNKFAYIAINISSHSLQHFAIMHCSVSLNQICNSCSPSGLPHTLRSMHMAHKTHGSLWRQARATTNSKLFIHFIYIELKMFIITRYNLCSHGWLCMSTDTIQNVFVLTTYMYVQLDFALIEVDDSKLVDPRSKRSLDIISIQMTRPANVREGDQIYVIQHPRGEQIAFSSSDSVVLSKTLVMIV